RSCIIFLCSEPGSVDVLGGLTLSTFTVYSDENPARTAEPEDRPEIVSRFETQVGSRPTCKTLGCVSGQRRSHRPSHAVNPGTFFAASDRVARQADCPL